MTGDKWEMVRWLLKPKVYLRFSSSDFLTRVCRKGGEQSTPEGGQNNIKQGTCLTRREAQGERI